MKPIAVLIGIELVLLIGVHVATGRRWRETATYLILLTAPLEVYRTTLGGVNPSLFRISVGIGVFVLALELWRQRPITRAQLISLVRHPIVLVYLAIAALVALSELVNSTGSGLGWRLLATILVGVTAVVVVTRLADRIALSSLVTALAVGCVLPMLAGAWQVLTYKAGWDSTLPLLGQLPVAEGLEKSREAAGFLGDIAIRERGTFGDANHFGALLIFSLLLAIALTVHAALRRRPDLVATFAGLTIAVAATMLATYSRSAWLGATVAVLLAGVLVVPKLARRVSRKTMLLAAAVTLVAAAVVAVPLAPELTARLDSDESANQISNESHGETIEAAWDLFKDSPVLGAGVGAIGEELDQGARTSGAHSSYMTTLAELGAVGLLTLLAAAAIVLRAMISLRRRHRDDPDGVLVAALLGAYVGFAVSAIVYDLWWDDFHWGVLAVVAALAAARTSHTEPTSA